MKLQTKLFLVFGVSNLVVCAVLIASGIFLINTLISHYSKLTMELQLKEIVSTIEELQSTLDNAGLSSLPLYQKSMKDDVLKKYASFSWGKHGVLCIIPDSHETYYLGAIVSLQHSMSPDGLHHFFDHQTGMDYLVHGATAKNGWYVAICMRKDELFQSSNEYIVWGIFFSLLMLILTFCTVFILSTHFSTQINELLLVMRQAAAGDLNAQVSYKPFCTENAELKKEVNDMIGDLKLREQERDLAQEESRKNQKAESIGLLAGGIAHDFNNLLTAIRGNIQLATMMNNDEKTMECLIDCERATGRAVELTKQLLTFAKGGSPFKTSHSVTELLEHNTRFILRGSRSKCVFHFAPDTKLVEIDLGQIGQAIDNIIINADQSMPSGGIINISTENINVPAKSNLPLAPGNYVRIKIKDHGNGISKEDLPRVFDPFFTTKPMGTGLGLPTADNIIRRHNGHLSVSSTVGKGSCFTIFLPATANNSTADHAASPNELKLNYLAGGKVLVMDDQMDIRAILGKILSAMNCICEFAADGQEAIERFRRANESGEPFDIVFLDLTIPGGMDGREALVKLKEIDPDAIVVVASGYSNDPIMSDYEKYGFSDRLEKPFKIVDIGRIMERFSQKFHRFDEWKRNSGDSSQDLKA